MMFHGDSDAAGSLVNEGADHAENAGFVEDAVGGACKSNDGSLDDNHCDDQRTQDDDLADGDGDHDCCISESESSFGMIPEFVDISTGTNIASQYDPQQHCCDNQRRPHVAEGEHYNNDGATAVSSVTGLTRDDHHETDMEDTKERYRRQLAIRMYQDEAHDSSNHPMSPKIQLVVSPSISTPPQSKSPKKVITSACIGRVCDPLPDHVHTNNKLLGFIKPQHVRVSYSNEYRNSRLLQQSNDEESQSIVPIKDLNTEKMILCESSLNGVGSFSVDPAAIGALPIADLVVESGIVQGDEEAGMIQQESYEDMHHEMVDKSSSDGEESEPSTACTRRIETPSPTLIVSPMESFAEATPAPIRRGTNNGTDRTSKIHNSNKKWMSRMPNMLQRTCPLIVALIALMMVVILAVVLVISGIFSPTPSEHSNSSELSQGTRVPNEKVHVSQRPIDTAQTMVPTVASTNLLEHESIDWIPMGSDITCLLYGHDEEENDNLLASQRGSRLGTSVAMSSDGKIVAIGAPGSHSDTGHVQVHEWSHSLGEWIVRGQVLAGSQENDQFGISLDLNQDGTILAVGAVGHSNNVGRVQVFEWSTILRGGGFVGQWLPLGSTLEGRGPLLSTDSNGSNFGRSVSLSADGKVFSVGASQWDDSDPDAIADADEYAQVYFFDESIQDWKQRGEDLINPDVSETDDLGMGASVSLTDDGLTCSVGVPRYFRGIGINARYEFDSEADEWKPRERNGLNELRDRVNIGDHYGASVALTGDGQYGCVRAASGMARIGYLSKSEEHVQLDLEALDYGEYFFGNTDEHQDSARVFGGSLAITHTDGQQVIVGSGNYDIANEDAHPGFVTIHSYVPDFETNIGTWNLIGSRLAGSSPGDRFGDSIAISKDGSIVAVGASRGIATKTIGGISNETPGGYVRIYRAATRF